MKTTPRERLAEILRAQGFQVEAETIQFPRGGSRRWQEWDETTIRWDVEVVRKKKRYQLVSGDPITDCVKYGVILEKPDGQLIRVRALKPAGGE